ncbi:hypothetical protein [Halalkalicoccus salilacus]|uniref:hypothetical protein n=1 Tax=Halalkalicoccus sp. GCM10025704 TaxID=3252662 RepID=UPI003619D127
MSDKHAEIDETVTDSNESDDEIRSEIALSEIDVGDDGELVAPLTDDTEPVVVRMHPRDDGRLTVEVSDTASGRELYRRPQPADWYTKDQLVRTIKNKITDAHPDDLEPPFIALAGLFDSHHDEIKQAVLPRSSSNCSIRPSR